MDAANETPASPPPASPVRESRWPRWLSWLLIAMGLCLLPIVVLAGVVASCLTLNRDAAALRQEVMAAAPARWHTQVQLSVGRPVMDLARVALHFAHCGKIDEAKTALNAVHGASVGVYQCRERGADLSIDKFLGDTDRKMRNRGWTRLVAVADTRDHVLVYVPEKFDPDAPVDLCVAVLNDRELVIVSTTVDANALAELATLHGGLNIHERLRTAKVF